MAKRFGLVLAIGILAAAPAGAVRDLSGKGALPTGSPVLYGSTHATDNAPLNNRLVKGPQPAKAVSPVREPANWLMMLIGFGVLGAMSRRSETDRFRDEMVF